MANYLEALATIVLSMFVPICEQALKFDPVVLTWPHAHESFAKRIEKVDKVILLEGLPRPTHAGSEEPPKLKSTKIKKLHGFQFYEKMFPMKEDDAKQLSALLRESKSFKPIPGNETLNRFCGIIKLCGGFHPDFCIEFHKGKEVYHVLVCFGCEEVRCHGPSVNLSYDIQPMAVAAFTKILYGVLKECPK